jgi:hypothetical protein
MRKMASKKVMRARETCAAPFQVFVLDALERYLPQSLPHGLP